MDALVYREILRLKSESEKNWNAIEADVKKWLRNKAGTERQIADMRTAISNLETDIENILMERINDKENRDAYDRLLVKKRSQIDELKVKINELANLEETIKKRRKGIKENINMLDNIVAEGAISNTNLRLLIQEIQILDVGNNEIAVVVVLNGQFNEYGEVFDENGGVELAHNGDYKPVAIKTA